MLYVFDLDSTLVTRYRVDVLPGVSAKLDELAGQGHALAVATNQAGPAWRTATGRSKYPDPARLGARLARIADSLAPLARVPWFVAIGDGRLELSDGDYRDIEIALCRGAGSLDLRPSADLVWRKPGPGMLLAACAHYGLPTEAATYVGDMETDAAAAAGAGAAFAYANVFFGSAGG